MQTLGRRDELRGVLAVALPERPDTSATAVITSAVALAEFAVEDAARREESTLALNAQLFQLALVGHVDAVRDVLVAAGRQLPEAPLRLLLTRLPGDSEAGELEHALTVRTARSQQWVLATRWQGRFAAVVGTGAARDAAEVIGARQTPVVMSRPVGWADLVAALHETRDALDSAPADAGVIELETSAILGLLSRDEIESLARERLTPLLAAPDGADLRRVLETWLRHNAAWDPAARELGMHRHTLKTQVRRAGGLVRLDLDTFEAKAELWAMLTAAGGGRVKSAEWLAERFGLAGPASLEGPVDRGFQGQVWRLTCGARTYAVKEALVPLDHDQVVAAYALQQRAEAAGVVAPRQLLTVTGDPAVYVDGETLRVFDWLELAPPDRDLDPTALGRLLARAAHRRRSDHRSGRSLVRRAGRSGPLGRAGGRAAARRGPVRRHARRLSSTSWPPARPSWRRRGT